MSIAINATDAAYASNSDTVIYTAPASTKAIIDKFTAQNSDASSQTLNVNIIPSGGSVGATNLVMNATAIATTITRDFTELQNQILKPGDKVSVKASVASKVVIRLSVRESS